MKLTKSLTPCGGEFVKIVRSETAGGDEEVQTLNLAAQPPAVVLMAGLQGAAKPPASVLGKFLREKHKKKVADAHAWRRSNSSKRWPVGVGFLPV